VFDIVSRVCWFQSPNTRIFCRNEARYFLENSAILNKAHSTFVLSFNKRWYMKLLLRISLNESLIVNVCYIQESAYSIIVQNQLRLTGKFFFLLRKKLFIGENGVCKTSERKRVWYTLLNNHTHYDASYY